MKMPDKKLTDEEIIKRLERCVKRGNRNYDTDIVLDLINRQESEIERLQKEVNLVSILFQDLQERTDEIKAEAYREFAERLKNKWFAERYDSPDVDFDDFIDNLLTEMVGEEE